MLRSRLTLPFLASLLLTSACSPSSGRASFLNADDTPDGGALDPDDGSTGEDSGPGAGGSGGGGHDGEAGGAGGSGGSGGGGTGGSGGTGGGDLCPTGAFTCEGNVKVICDGQGGEQYVSCGSKVCVENQGCVVCKPGSFDCAGHTVRTCRADGSGWDDTETCDAELGLACDPTYGWCAGSCSPDALGNSYIGCEYFPTVTANLVNPSFDFAIAVSNTSSEPATVKVTGGALGSALTFTVPALGLEVRTLPWVPLLKACNTEGLYECGGTSQGAALAKNGAYRLKSTQPVTVYQFNPLQYAKGGKNSYSNDASLLLPANAMTGNYYVAAWPYWKSQFPGLVAVTATHDGTQVTVNPKVAVGGTPSFAANTPTTVTMNRGDVLQLLNHSGDLTGSFVSANKPVQVIGGHHCTQLPNGTEACDHLEESMFPVETLSDHYIVTSPAVPSLPNGKIEHVRIVAVEPNTSLTYDPPQSGAATSIANAGQFIEIRNANNFAIKANKRILVAQYMNGQAAGGGTGDPAMTVAVATAQFRTEYLFHAPTNYDTNYVNIVAPTGATITLDGVVQTGFTAIGSTDYGILRKQLAKNGTHKITGDQPFGISVYGYGQYTSYWYPGGLNLTQF